MPTAFPEDRLNELEAAIFAGRKIAAIKLYRELTGLGLKESKEAVERIEADLRARSPEKFTAPAGRGCSSSAARLLVVVTAVGLLAWIAVAWA